jgi:predicted transcriptional regulator
MELSEHIERTKTMADVPRPAQAGVSDVLALTAQIVASHAANNTVDASALPGLIHEVFRALSALGQSALPPVEKKAQVPAVPWKKSVFPDYIVCLEDGKKLKMLKRHLKTAYNLTPEEYRERWGLPPDYPMVAPSYATHRSSLAKKSGLGKARSVAPGEQ